MQTDGYNKNFYKAYQQSSDTVNQIEQIVMLYDGAINFIKQAREAIIEQNYEKRYNLINKAIAIITGLNSCLNFTNETEDTAKALDDFYSMIDLRLLYIQCDDSIEACDKVIEDLRVMRNAWADVSVKQVAVDDRGENIDSVKKESLVIEEVKTDSIVIQTSDVEGKVHAELQINA